MPADPPFTLDEALVAAAPPADPADPHDPLAKLQLLAQLQHVPGIVPAGVPVGNPGRGSLQAPFESAPVSPPAPAVRATSAPRPGSEKSWSTLGYDLATTVLASPFAISPALSIGRLALTGASAAGRALGLVRRGASTADDVMVPLAQRASSGPLSPALHPYGPPGQPSAAWSARFEAPPARASAPFEPMPATSRLPRTRRDPVEPWTPLPDSQAPLAPQRLPIEEIVARFRAGETPLKTLPPPRGMGHGNLLAPETIGGLPRAAAEAVVKKNLGQHPVVLGAIEGLRPGLKFPDRALLRQLNKALDRGEHALATLEGSPLTIHLARALLRAHGKW